MLSRVLKNLENHKKGQRDNLEDELEKKKR